MHYISFPPPPHTCRHTYTHPSLIFLVKTGGLVSEYLIFVLVILSLVFLLLIFVHLKSNYLLFLHIIFFQLSVCVHAIMFCSAVIMVAISKISDRQGQRWLSPLTLRRPHKVSIHMHYISFPPPHTHAHTHTHIHLLSFW